MANITETYEIHLKKADGTQGDTLFSVTIFVPQEKVHIYDDYQWDSHNGLITAKDTRLDRRVVIPHTGYTTGALTPEQLKLYEEGNIILTKITALDYDFWYY